MTATILVPIADLAHDEVSLDAACRLAAQLEAQIIMLHLEPASAAPADVAKARERLETCAAERRASGAHIDVVVETGEAAADMPQHAQRHRADFIIMAPHRRAFFESLRHPSVTSGMLGRTPAPLVVLPAAVLGKTTTPVPLLAGPGASVIVGLDGSARAETALPVAVRIAQRFGRPLLLVRVVPIRLLASGGPSTSQLNRQMLVEERQAAQQYLQRTRERIQDESHLEVQTMRLDGDATERLAELAVGHPGSILIICTHGRSGLARMLLGSVANALIHRVSVPLVVVPIHSADGAMSSRPSAEGTECDAS